MQVRARQSGFVRTEGGLLPADLLERVRALDPKLPGMEPAAYGLERGDRFGEATTRAWNRMVGAWTALQDGLAQLPETDPATTTTRERFLLPLMDELGYGRLSPTKAIDLDGKSYPVSHGWQEVIPLHLVGANVPLDRRTQRVAGAAGQSPHGLLQELLNRSPERLWGIVSNGLVLRILRDNASLTRQAYVEFDLEAIMAGESYADFALLWHLAHRSRLEPRRDDAGEEGSAPTVHGCYLERWSKVAEETGARARDRLRDGVQEAIEALGSGFLRHPANTELKTQLQAGTLSTQDYYRELLRLVYRLILLFVAEDRDLLLDPKADPATRDRYARYYSTARLRRLAERRKGSRHADLYAGLRVVIAALGRDEGAPGIGLPPLGGFLFGPDACPHLDDAQLANADLLDAIRKLATIEEKGVLRSVDYRNLASEELGSIYESLLERHPELDIPTASFVLKVAAGHERKTTGSYYTPTSLISVLLDSALDPVLAEAADKPTKEGAERAILELSVVDPAAGSGHFLVAAAHRIAKRLAQVRTGDEEPAPEAIRTALRDVIGHCLYAVDINPMAVELCKVSLWLEALEPGKPLTFLDAHIKCGNSLLGTTPELIVQGIPDAAYDPIEGDDKVVCKVLKKRNRAEREGQLSLGEAALTMNTEELADCYTVIDAIDDGDATSLRKKTHLHQSLTHGRPYVTSRLIADAWCAAFLTPKRASSEQITTASLRLIAGGEIGAPVLRGQIAEISSRRRVFHWHLEFPQVYRRGGFDAVLGNPPWDKTTLIEREYFAVSRPDIAEEKRSDRRKKLIEDLRVDEPELWFRWEQDKRNEAAYTQFLRSSGLYPGTGVGELNLYPLFVERSERNISRSGRVGLVVKTGMLLSPTWSGYCARLLELDLIRAAFDFRNWNGWFPDVAFHERFTLLVLGRAAGDDASSFGFYLDDPAQTLDPAKVYSLSAVEAIRLNPLTKSVPAFSSPLDRDLVSAIYRRFPILAAEETGWGARYSSGFHMSMDADKFKDQEELSAAGLVLDDSGVMSNGEQDYFPLYEGKFIHQFDHRFGSFDGIPRSNRFGVKAATYSPTDAQKADPSYHVVPRYWVSADDYHFDAAKRRIGNPWALAFRNTTNVISNRRTAVAAICAGVAYGDKAPNVILEPPGQASRAITTILFVSLMNSFAFDYVLRQKFFGVNLLKSLLMQMAVPGLEQVLAHRAWLVPRAAELSCTSHAMLPLLADLGLPPVPFVWNSERRSRLRAELDAAFFHIYEFDRDAVSHALDGFPILAEAESTAWGEFKTKRMILEQYDLFGGGEARTASDASA